MAIPLILFQVGRRTDFPHRWILWLFVAFILSCGTTHLFDVLSFHRPMYRLDSVIRVATALVSWTTVAALVPLTPKLLAMKSPETLQKEIERRRAVEAELREAHAELEKRVADRTRELKETNDNLKREITENEALAVELQRKGDELEASNKELEEFAYVASHDLQEPLRKISSFGELLDEEVGDQLNEDAKMYLDRMVDASERMAGMIRDLLQLSRSSKGEYRLEPVDLSDVVRSVLLDLEAAIEEAHADVEIEELPPAMVDRVQIEQVFRNLLSNAIKYRKMDTPLQVTISSRRLDGHVEVTVRDNGIGFDPQYADRILKPFQRLHGRSEYEGSGIGLALCKKIVDRHGGTLTAVGKPGEGAEFRFTLNTGEDGP